jgi:hypothetical protein
MPKPIPKPMRAEEVLATVAARYPAGATVTNALYLRLTIGNSDVLLPYGCCI